MNPGRRRCPVCWRLVQRTVHGAIEGHWDTAGTPCRGISEPYRITLGPRPSRVSA